MQIPVGLSSRRQVIARFSENENITATVAGFVNFFEAEEVTLYLFPINYFVWYLSFIWVDFFVIYPLVHFVSLYIPCCGFSGHPACVIEEGEVRYGSRLFFSLTQLAGRQEEGLMKNIYTLVQVLYCSDKYSTISAGGSGSCSGACKSVKRFIIFDGFPRCCLL